MGTRRRVTENDLLITEARIAKSYGRLKQSVIQAPSRALKSVGTTAGTHPYATAAIAVIAGAVLYGIYRKMTSPGAGNKVKGSGRGNAAREKNPMYDILMMLLPMMIPYIPRYLQAYLGGALFGKRA